MLEEKEYDMLIDIRNKSLTCNDKHIINEIAKNNELDLKETINVIWNELFDKNNLRGYNHYMTILDDKSFT